MMQEKGTISIHTENIFPIIKKFLYSDNEIFLRELVSNAVDATQKIKRLSSLGQYNGDLGKLQVEVSFDEAAKTITISGYNSPAQDCKGPVTGTVPMHGKGCFALHSGADGGPTSYQVTTIEDHHR